MGDLTANFSRSEFACSCGDCDNVAVDFMLVKALQEACDHFAEKYNQTVSCKITSGNRCIESNIKALMQYSGKTLEEAKQSKSKHLFSMAADHKFYLKQSNHQIEPEEVAEYYETKYSDSFGIGRYHNRTHLDSRDIKARW